MEAQAVISVLGKQIWKDFRKVEAILLYTAGSMPARDTQWKDPCLKKLGKKGRKDERGGKRQEEEIKEDKAVTHEYEVEMTLRTVSIQLR